MLKWIYVPRGKWWAKSNRDDLGYFPTFEIQVDSDGEFGANIQSKGVDGPIKTFPTLDEAKYACEQRNCPVLLYCHKGLNYGMV